MAKLLSYKLLKANDLAAGYADLLAQMELLLSRFRLEFLVTEFVEMQCDVPNLVQILANFFERFLVDNKSNIRFFSKVLPLIPCDVTAKKCTDLIKKAASARISVEMVEHLFRKSGLKGF